MLAIAQEKLVPGHHSGFDSRAVVQSDFDPTSIQIAVKNSGAVFVLWKSRSGWKGNYEGYVCSSVNIPPQRLTKDSHGRDILALDGLDSVYPVVRERETDNCLRVFFDLN